MTDKSNLVDDCRKYLGKTPYNTSSNICLGDGYFYMSMCNKYGEQEVINTIKALRKED